MKNVGLEKIGVQELSIEEMRKIEGGSLWGLAKEAFSAVVGAISDFAEGVGQGYHSGRIERVIETSQQIA